MLTLAKYIKLAALLLGCLILSGSGNQRGTIGFWHVLNSKANVSQSYWHFSSYFTAHLEQLPDSRLVKLARLSIPLAQYIYSLRLLEGDHLNTAKIYWGSAVSELPNEHREVLAQHLLARSRWGDLAFLNDNNFLPEGATKEYLKLELGVNHNKVSSAFVSELGFASLGDDIKPKPHCLFNVLTMSNHRSGLNKLDELIAIYNQTPEPHKNVFCFSKPVYVAGAVQCGLNENQAARCEMQTIAHTNLSFDDFDFKIMMPRHGTANVTNDTMHINSTATYPVFLHELMHFNGFEDEYVLPQAKQAWLCTQRGYVAPNLYISDDGHRPKGWHKAKSCQKGGVAYKPSENWSIMEYQQLGLSDQYRALWLNHLDIVKADLKRAPRGATSINKGVKSEQIK